MYICKQNKQHCSQSRKRVIKFQLYLILKKANFFVIIRSHVIPNRKEEEEFKDELCEALSYSAYHGNISTVKLLLHFNVRFSWVWLLVISLSVSVVRINKVFYSSVICIKLNFQTFEPN